MEFIKKLKKSEFGSDVRKVILDIYKCPFFKIPNWVCEKHEKKRPQTEML